MLHDTLYSIHMSSLPMSAPMTTLECPWYILQSSFVNVCTLECPEYAVGTTGGVVIMWILERMILALLKPHGLLDTRKIMCTVSAEPIMAHLLTALASRSTWHLHVMQYDRGSHALYKPPALDGECSVVLCLAQLCSYYDPMMGSLWSTNNLVWFNEFRLLCYGLWDAGFGQVCNWP